MDIDRGQRHTHALAGNWSQERFQDSNPGTLTGGVGISSNVLTAAPNVSA